MEQTKQTKIKVNNKQRAALKLLFNGENIELLYGGAAGGGKSYAGCLWLWLMCRKYPGTRYFIARRHKKDLDGSSVVTFFEVLRTYEGGGREDYDPTKYWRYSSQGGYINHARNGARIDLLATEYEPTDPQYNRFGSIEFTAGWIEEAQETSREAAKVLFTRIGRRYNAKYNLPEKLFLTCNPSKNWLYTDFYRPFINGTLETKKRVILATMKDNRQFLTKQYMDKMNAETDPIIKQRLTEGRWEWDEDESYLIPARSVALAVEVPPVAGALRVGIDVGLFGTAADKSIIQVLDGNIIKAPIVIDCQDYTGDPALYDDWLAATIADYIRDLERDRGPLEVNAVRIDASGAGDAINQKLKHTHGISCYPFRGSNPAFPRRGSTQKFNNLRSQSYYEFKEGLRLKKWHLPANYDEDLYNELIQQRYVVRNDTIALWDKSLIRRILGRSPDKADALTMAALLLPQSAPAGTIATTGAARPKPHERPGRFGGHEWQ